MADDMGDKTEAPTPKRRQEAREQGNIARSADLTAAVLLLTVMLLLHSYGGGVITALKTIMAQMFGFDAIQRADPHAAGTLLLSAVRMAAVAMAPLFVGVCLVAILINMIQVGLVFNTQRLQPQLGALNPLKGLGKLFSKKENLVHMLMNLVKLALVAFVAYSAVHGRIERILSAQQLTFAQIFGLGTEIVYSIALRIGMILLVLAIIDYAYQRWNTEQKLKMSKQEIKEEMRRMEGDPQIKSRRRQIAMQRTVQAIKQNVPTADVIVTNPTHYSIALKYDPKTMNAPRVVAKGADFLALQIRQIAIESGIPILERPPLARALYRLCDVGQEVPEQFYSTVAEILAYVYELSGKSRRQQPVGV